MDFRELEKFYGGKRVLVTGHTGFKGTWLCRILTLAGAQVTGYALEPPTDPSIFAQTGMAGEMHSVIGDIRDLARLRETFEKARPEVVFHLAAQPIVREGYRDPVGTYAVNVMGTVHLLECVRRSDSVRSVINVTTDKVYDNREWAWPYRESDRLDGCDPYSNSKSCSELVTHSYLRSFLGERGVAVSTMRAGNVIGGGDFSKDRIIPDCVRAAVSGAPITIRNPYSIRPYQHVLEPLFVYLEIAMRQAEDPGVSGWYNVGPDPEGLVTTGRLAEMFACSYGDGVSLEAAEGLKGPHEAGLLKLDNSKIKEVFGWKPVWGIERAVDAITAWTKAWLISNESANEELIRQVIDYVRS